jgi:purine-binding chemotaxis protein CheW
MSRTVVVFRVDNQRCALPLNCVERIVRAVEVTPLPGAPAIVLGAVCVAGRVLPVLSMRWRLGLAAREVRPRDHFLIGRAASRRVVLAIDEADGLIQPDETRFTPAGDIAAGIGHVRGMARLDDGLVLIEDLDRFLSFDEGRALDTALVTAESS